MRFMLVAVLFAAAAPVSAAPSPVGQPASLDALLAAADYPALSSIVRSRTTTEEMVSDLDWLRANMLAGESAFVSMLYARMVWDSAATMPAPRQRAMRNVAAFALLYAQAQIWIDGVRCGDPSAPEEKAALLGMMIPELPAFVAALSPEERKSLAERVWQIERDTATPRDRHGDIKFLCSGGMNEMAYNMDHSSTQKLPDKPGGWKHIEVTGDSTYKPELRPDAEWKSLAARLRAELPRRIAKLVEQMSRPVAD